MKRLVYRRTLPLGIALCGLVAAPCAQAGTVRGQLSFPAERAEPVAEGLWRIDNGIVPVTPRAVDPRNDCLVLLQPRSSRKDAGKPEPVTAELRGLRLQPAVIAVSLGGSVEIKNEDRVPHTLAAVEADVFPARPTPAGSTRNEQPQRPGVFALRDEEQPHLRGWLVVSEGAIAVRPDEHGAWKAEVPDGRYTVRVFLRGAFPVEKTIDVGVRPVELPLAIPAGTR